MARDRVLVAPVSPDSAARAATVARAFERGFRHFVLAAGSPDQLPPGTQRWTLDNDRLLAPPVVDRDARVIPVRSISSPAELAEALRVADEAGGVALRWLADRVIPLESAVARRSPSSRIWVFAEHPADVPAALGALERGADRVIVEISDPSGVDELESLLESAELPALTLVTVAVTRRELGGMGDRVVVDTTSILQPTEGLLVGSAAAFLFLVASEATGSRHSRPRPFRINAGAAHSYTLLSDGTTRYLTELEPGDSVLVTTAAGAMRAVRVGRIKIERRPLLLLAAEVDGRQRTVFLQEAETVRLCEKSGPMSVTDLRRGSEVYGAILPAARHLGVSIDESIEER